MPLLDFSLMQPPDPTSLGESMRVPERDPMEIYKRLFGIFAPQFSAPSEDFEKQNRRDAILAAGAAMLSGGDLMEGMGRAGQAFGQQMYDRRQDEQSRLDLRSREDALSRYRAASAAGVGREPEPQEDNSLFTAMLAAYPELREQIIATGGDLVALRSLLRDANKPEDPGWQPPPQAKIDHDLMMAEERAKINARYPGSPQAPPREPTPGSFPGISPSQTEQAIDNVFALVMSKIPEDALYSSRPPGRITMGDGTEYSKAEFLMLLAKQETGIDMDIFEAMKHFTRPGQRKFHEPE